MLVAISLHHHQLSFDKLLINGDSASAAINYKPFSFVYLSISISVFHFYSSFCSSTVFSLPMKIAKIRKSPSITETIVDNQNWSVEITILHAPDLSGALSTMFFCSSLLKLLIRIAVDKWILFNAKPRQIFIHQSFLQREIKLRFQYSCVCFKWTRVGDIFARLFNARARNNFSRTIDRHRSFMRPKCRAEIQSRPCYRSRRGTIVPWKSTTPVH